MRYIKIIFLIFIFSSLIFSGCLREYYNIEITSVDASVSGSQQDNKTTLMITSHIQNNQNTDTGVLTAKIKIRDPSTNLITAETDSDIGYIKSKSSADNRISLTVPDSGEYVVEVQVFEKGKIVAQYSTSVTVKVKPGPSQPADIKLTDMGLVVTKIYNDGSSALIDVSPGIYNQGGDSNPLTIEVTARVDQYTAYTKTDDLGIVKGGSSIRGKVSFDIPRDKLYTFTVGVIENGKTVTKGSVNEKIKLSDIKYNTPVTFVLVEEGKPRPTPGFEVAITLISILLVYSVLIRTRQNKKVR